MLKYFCLIAALSLGLSACGEKEAASAPASTEPGKVALAAKAAVDKSKHARLDRHPIKDLTNYQRLPYMARPKTVEAEQATEKAFRDMYWSSAPMDEMVFAYDHFPEYRQEADTFNRKDIVSAKRAEIDSLYRHIQANPYFALETDAGIEVKRYDEKVEGFKFSSTIPKGSSILWRKPKGYNDESSQWGFRTVGQEIDLGSDDPNLFGIFKPKTEQEARALEGRLSDIGKALKTKSRNPENLPALYLGHTVGTYNDNGLYTSIYVIDGIIVLNPNTREPLFTLTKAELGSSFPVTERDLLKPLNLHEKKGAGGYVTF